MTLQEYLAQIQKRCDAATEGPWQYDWNRDDMVQDKHGNPVVTDDFLMRGDQEFIAHARQDVEVLLQMVNEVLTFNPRYDYMDTVKKLESLVPGSSE